MDGILREKTMELNELITQLQAKIDDADVALDAGDVDEAKASLREARDLLDDEFLKN